jgi:hypothetical protein
MAVDCFAMRLAALAACLLAAAACRDPDPRGAPDAAPAAGPALPPSVQVAPSVCTLKTELLRPLADIGVRASGTTPAYATVTAPKLGSVALARRELSADLGIPSDDTMPFSLRVYGGAFELRGIVERSVPIYAGMPLALGAFAAALPRTELKVLRATALEVEVEAQLGGSVEILAGAPRTRGPCGLFAFERRDFAASAVIPGVKWKEQPDALLKKGRKIALSTLPQGEPVARIEIREGDSAAAVVFEREKDRAHIGWYGSTLMIHGWIAGSELEPLPKEGPRPAEPPPPSRPEPEGAGAARVACPEAIPLVSLTGEARTTVGTVRAGAPFEVLDRDRGWAEVRGTVPLVRFAAGSHLVVRESDLSRCAPFRPASPR